MGSQPNIQAIDMVIAYKNEMKIDRFNNDPNDFESSFDHIPHVSNAPPIPFATQAPERLKISNAREIGGSASES